MKKIFLLVSICLIFPQQSFAAFSLPKFTLNIIEVAQSGDGVFTFGAYSSNSVGFNLLPEQQTQITTSNGQASAAVSLTLQSAFQVIESEQQGWSLANVVCNSTDPTTAFVLVNEGIQMSGFSNGDVVNCTFTNSLVAAQKTPILIIPGVLGTDIYQGNNLLWANPKMSFISDGFMDPLGLNSNLSPIDSDLILGNVIRQRGALGFISHYTDGLINQLASSDFGYTEGKDLFTFPYDWRYGVSEDNVNQLKGQINYILTQTDAGKAAGKVDIVAHSTGGLLVKKYVMENPTTHGIGKAIFVGVPNLGAPKAIKTLLEGDNFDVPGLDPAEMQKIAQNMPVIYDLSPSAQYYNSLGSYMRVGVLNVFSPSYKDLTFSQAQDYLKTNHFNSQAIDNSANLHSANFDNYDLRSEGINLYSIVGCKTSTIGKVLDERDINGTHIDYTPNPDGNFSGDGTVPFGSADSLVVDEDKVFFAPKVKHGDMLSVNGPLQEIVNLLTGSNLDTKGKILTHNSVQQNPSLCQIKGENLKIHSPLAIDIVDQDGNHSGPLPDGSIENSIPGADYEVWGEEKYVFLPTDDSQQYKINVAGTGNGTFTLDDESVDNNIPTQTQVFSNLPVTPALTGTVSLGSGGGQATLSIEATPTSTPVVVGPSSIVNAEQSEDLTAPVSTSTIAGIMGQPGFYRSNVTVSLTAADQIIPGQESQTSGLLKTQYNLDGQGYQTYSTSSPIMITTEGQHSISFFSTDKAGNNEPEQAVVFTIDKTAPEFNIQFNPNIQDLQFTATDTSPTELSSSTLATLIKKGFKGFPKRPLIKVIDSDDAITATDAAGNISQITLAGKDRKHNLKADIKSLTYNGKAAGLSKNILHFDWLYDKKNSLQILTQQIQSKKDFNILAIYGLNKTLVTGKDQSGEINKIISGLDLLTVTTKQGDLSWSY